MPELPEVQSLKEYFERKFLGKEITDLKVVNKKILGNVSASRLKEKLMGAIFISAYRYGKYLFVKTSRGFFLVFHFGMTGSLEYFKDENKIPYYTRMILTFSSGLNLVFKCMRMFGRIYLADSLAGFINSKGLGPDALEINKSDFYNLIRKRKGKIKSVLLDQSFIAGVGNIYTDEILFQSGIHPETRVGLLDKRKLERIYNNIGIVLGTAVKSNAEMERYPGFYLSRNRNKNVNCPKCNTKIRRINVSGRGTYFCPRCQRFVIS